MQTQEDIDYKAAIQVVQDLLADKELWFRLKAVGLDLSDALDDMNDAIRGIEGVFRLYRFRPGWVPLDDQAALIWTGDSLMHDSGESTRPLLSTNKKWRIRSLVFVPPLYEELSRKRLIPGTPARTPTDPEP
jgi:hypothetical protein